MTQLGGAICAIFILVYQLQILPFFLPRVLGVPAWPPVYYGFWILAAVATVVAIVIQREKLKPTLPTLIACGVCAALTLLLHPLDQISKNFIVALVFVVCASTLALTSGPLQLLWLSAAVTTATASICLIDALFPNGMSNVSGRAAGLAINPNDAAASLLLGASAAYWAVPMRWRGYFLLIITAAVFVTLSKSIVLAGAGIACVTGLACRRLPRIAWRPHAAAAAALVGWIAIALYVNPHFARAAHLAYQGIDTAMEASENAQAAIQHDGEIIAGISRRSKPKATLTRSLPGGS
jgi:hypothetical protein